jgi:hypothetical protein
MAESWECVSEATMTKTHKAQERAFGGWDAHTGGETSMGTL